MPTKQGKQKRLAFTARDLVNKRYVFPCSPRFIEFGCNGQEDISILVDNATSIAEARKKVIEFLDWIIGEAEGDA